MRKESGRKRDRREVWDEQSGLKHREAGCESNGGDDYYIQMTIPLLCASGQSRRYAFDKLRLEENMRHTDAHLRS